MASLGTPQQHQTRCDRFNSRSGRVLRCRPRLVQPGPFVPSGAGKGAERLLDGGELGGIRFFVAFGILGVDDPMELDIVDALDASTVDHLAAHIAFQLRAQSGHGDLLGHEIFLAAVALTANVVLTGSNGWSWNPTFATANA